MPIMPAAMPLPIKKGTLIRAAGILKVRKPETMRPSERLRQVFLTLVNMLTFPLV
jgi:hypothetical protein